MLHVVNGDAALELLSKSGIEGNFLAWKDMLMEGPIPADGRAIDTRSRAAFLRGKYGADPKRYRAAMKALDAALSKAARGKSEVVLWFEEDFFCQIHLVYLLAHLPAALRRKGRASVICPDKPLAARLPSAFPKLFANRLPVSRPLLVLAEKVWKAYAAGSAKGWEAFLGWARSGDAFAPWPLLRTGLRSHLGRLATAHGGPNALETALLRSLSAGASDFGHFAKRVWAEPMVKPLGLADMQIARYALDLAEIPQPLIALEGTRPKPGMAPDPRDWKLRLTEAGAARLQEAETPPPAEASRNGRDTLAAPSAGAKALSGGKKSSVSAAKAGSRGKKPTASGAKTRSR